MTSHQRLVDYVAPDFDSMLGHVAQNVSGDCRQTVMRNGEFADKRALGSLSGNRCFFDVPHQPRGIARHRFDVVYPGYKIVLQRDGLVQRDSSASHCAPHFQIPRPIKTFYARPLFQKSHNVATRRDSVHHPKVLGLHFAKTFLKIARVCA